MVSRNGDQEIGKYDTIPREEFILGSNQFVPFLSFPPEISYICLGKVREQALYTDS
jgi:hypothetical protein